MDAYLHRRLGQTGLCGGFCHGQALDLHQLNRQAVAIGERTKQLAQVAAGVIRFKIHHAEQVRSVRGVVQGLTTRMRAVIIHELVAGDGVDPCREGLVFAIGVPGVVQCQQGLLQDVFHIGRRARQARTQESTQVPRQFIEEMSVRCRVARKATQEAVPQLLCIRRGSGHGYTGEEKIIGRTVTECRAVANPP